jgi:predicted helicase
MAYPRESTTKDLLKPNYALVFERFSVLHSYSNIFITNKATDLHILGTAYANGYTGAIYSYHEDGFFKDNTVKTPNLNKDIINQIATNLHLQFTNEKEPTPGTFAPIDILDYIYAVLHSPTFREKYKEFLKIDFPHVPYPKDVETFWHLVELGGELRQIHLLESLVVNKLITRYPVIGNNKVEKIKFENGNVWINETQYFEGVPKVSWEFYIGGYQPAQKWLKDRKGRVLNFEDILHYQKIIVALAETARIMGEIDEIIVE